VNIRTSSKGIASKVEQNPDHRFGEWKDKIDVKLFWVTKESRVELNSEEIARITHKRVVELKKTQMAVIGEGEDRHYATVGDTEEEVCQAKFAYVNSNFVGLMDKELDMKKLKLSDLREIATVMTVGPDAIFPKKEGGYRGYINGERYRLAKIPLDSDALGRKDGYVLLMSPISSYISSHNNNDNKLTINILRDEELQAYNALKGALYNISRFCASIASQRPIPTSNQGDEGKKEQDGIPTSGQIDQLISDITEKDNKKFRELTKGE